MKNVRAVLFDAGGTLIHMDGERASRAAGLSFEPAAFGRAYDGAVDAVRRLVHANPGSTDSDRMPLFLETLLGLLGVSEAGRREAALAVAAEHTRANLWSRGADDAASTLEALGRRGYRLAVVSNADGRVRGLLEGAGLGRHLEFVIDSAEVGLEKPDPRIFLEATARLGLRPADCAYVGDIYEIDVLGAREAGLEAVLIGTGEAPEDVRRVRTLGDLLGLFP